MILLLKALLVPGFSLLYQEGGQGVKLFKRLFSVLFLAICGSLILLLSRKINVFSVSGMFLYFAAANSFSYGTSFTKDKVALKVLFRGLCGLVYGLCGLLIAFGLGKAGLGVAQLILAIAGSIVFGVLNPFPKQWGNWATRIEDVCIAISYTIMLPFIL